MISSLKDSSNLIIIRTNDASLMMAWDTARSSVDTANVPIWMRD
jgi:hypothetical protein